MNNDSSNSSFEELKQLKNKTMFLFLPKNIVFEKNKKNDTIFISELKSISPFFYWCSAHEFKEFDQKYRFLMQYQIFNIEDNNIVSGELIQNWFSSKNEVRNELMKFIDFWHTHDRILIDNSKVNNFLEFGEYVASCIFNMKHIYINEVSNIGFDLMKKNFWKEAALNSDKKITKPKKTNLLTKNKKNSKSDTSKRKACKKTPNIH